MGLIREWLLLLLVREGSEFLKEPREGRHRVDIAVSLMCIDNLAFVYTLLFCLSLCPTPSSSCRW